MASFLGKFVWYDLATTDLKSAEAFYAHVIGWRTRDSGMPGVSYTILSAGETGVGGLMPLPEEQRKAGAKPGWMGYVWVDDVDAFAQRVSAAGGRVHRPPADIPSVGRFAVVADPHGAGFIIFKPSGGGESPAAKPGAVGHTDWHELRAGDLDSAFAFYSKLFGWTKDAALDMGPMGTYQMFKTGDVVAGGMMNKSPDMPAASWLYYFNVDSAEAAAARIKSQGGQVINGPHQVPGGSWIVQGTDLQGVKFAVVSQNR
jgi:uncharacterized protein